MRDNLLCEFLGSVMKANFVSLTNSFQLKEIKGMRRSAQTSSTGVRAVGYLNQSRSIGVGREPTPFVSLTKRLKFKEIKGMRSSALKPSMVVRVRGLEESDSDESKMKNSKETSFKIRHDG
ncbi:hypothetical protein N7489_011304 [Penicillium chrysogenum]|uniref:Uncharacterized protein n=1 Tax=Penicillium chrysogenum TaxID=5076 RepID=A0ABQ8W2U3_PENCH|nr:uncharacterized protein N7489_011304 [Penicillium chrysogenum]KAJ5230596.1 hypothetical protein N7489_011304 [Penicillium chrysogenum]KAJ5254475.1 hypothetical protein N7505_011684 [Penicillium chrysogenum]